MKTAEEIFPKKEEFEFDLPKNNLTNLQPVLQKQFNLYIINTCYFDNL